MVVAAIIVAVGLAIGSQAKSGDQTQPPNDSKNGLRAVTQNSHKPNWQIVPFPDRDGFTRLAFDANSIVVTNDEKGNVNGADVEVRVVDGDETIKGKQMVLSFDCGTSRLAGFHYRINHSYPIAITSSFPSQEGEIANHVCIPVLCEISHPQGYIPSCPQGGK